MRPTLATLAVAAALLVHSPAALADACIGGGSPVFAPTACFACVAYVVTCAADNGVSAETSDCPIGPGGEVLPCQIPVGDGDPIDGTCTYDHVTQDLDHAACVDISVADNAACSWTVGETDYEGVCADTCTVADLEGRADTAPKRAVNWTAVLLGLFLLVFVRRSLQPRRRSEG